MPNITRWSPHPTAVEAMIEDPYGDYVDYAELNRYRKALEMARDALGSAVEGLRLSYQVCDFPANGCSLQDDALDESRAALASVDQLLSERKKGGE
jgi:hypothetical protein